MPRLDPEFLESHEAAQQRHRPRPTTGRPVPVQPLQGEPAQENGTTTTPRHEGWGNTLWPALASFAVVFGLGVFVFWLLYPGRQPAVTAPPRGVALPSFALVAGWVAGLALLPRVLPRPLAWLLLAAGTVFVAIVLSREVTTWLQAVLGSIQL